MSLSGIRNITPLDVNKKAGRLPEDNLSSRMKSAYIKHAPTRRKLQVRVEFDFFTSETVSKPGKNIFGKIRSFLHIEGKYSFSTTM